MSTSSVITYAFKTSAAIKFAATLVIRFRRHSHCRRSIADGDAGGRGGIVIRLATGLNVAQRCSRVARGCLALATWRRV